MAMKSDIVISMCISMTCRSRWWMDLKWIRRMIYLKSSAVKRFWDHFYCRLISFEGRSFWNTFPLSVLCLCPH